ncbi:MAG: rhodanese-like domain-containing protein [Gammaproteobacteria bacterium]|nr:rhodanese-like domain-containing protein [Gammaproteobacteria bacterium]
MNTIEEIDVNQLLRLRESGQSHDLIDIRMPGEVMQGLIPGARHIAMKHLPAAMEELRQSDRVILYCRSGSRSAHACAALMAQGLDNVFNLRGGILAWAQSGQPLAEN